MFPSLGFNTFQTCFISDRCHTDVLFLYLGFQTFLTVTLLLSGLLASWERCLLVNSLIKLCKFCFVFVLFAASTLVQGYQNTWLILTLKIIYQGKEPQQVKSFTWGYAYIYQTCIAWKWKGLVEDVKVLSPESKFLLCWADSFFS